MKEFGVLPNKKTLKWLFSHTKRRLLALGMLASSRVVCSCLSVVFAVTTKRVIDSATQRDSETFLHACLFLFAVMAVEVLLNTWSLHVQEKLAADLDRDMKQNMMHHILRSDYSEISRYHSGDLLFRLNSDVNNIVVSILAIASAATSLGAGLLAAVVVLSQMDLIFTIAIFCTCAVIAVVVMVIQRHMKKLQKAVSASSGKVSGFLQEVMEKLLIVQALDVSQEIEERSNEMLEVRWQYMRRRKNVSITMSLGSSILGYAGSFVTLIWCSRKLLRGLITFGDLTAMTSLVSQLQGPLLTIPAILPKFVTITASAERLMEIEEVAHQPDPVDGNTRPKLSDSLSISVEDLSFSYTGKLGERKQVIKNVSCTLPTKGLTVITGPSGIGKSTLLKLLLGVYRPEGGAICFRSEDGTVPIDRSSRRFFSYAPQGNLLISGTIRENILLSNTTATEEELERAVYVSAVNEYLSELPNGLDTVLGENGAGLSEGQVQRISLARAVISGAPILLLDEVTSSLDAHTEQLVLERICALPDRACIAVTHRPAALKLADWELKVTEDDMKLVPVRT